MKQTENEVIYQQDFIDQLADKYGYSKASARMLVSDFLNLLIDNIEQGNTIFFSGYWKLSLVRRKGRSGFKGFMGENAPRVIDIPDHFSLKFSPGTKLKIALRKWAASREISEVGEN